MPESEIPKKCQKRALEVLEYYSKPQTTDGCSASIVLAEIRAERKRIEEAEKPFVVSAIIAGPHWPTVSALPAKVLGRFASRPPAEAYRDSLAVPHPQADKLSRQAAVDCVDKWIESRKWPLVTGWYAVRDEMLKPAKCVCGCSRVNHRAAEQRFCLRCDCPEYRPEPENAPCE